MTVGENIKRIRKEKGLTQKELGELCNINEANIRKYESGRQNPKIETIDKIADALGVLTSQIKEDITWAEHRQTSDWERIKKEVSAFDGIIAILANIYGQAEEKIVYGGNGIDANYYLIGKNKNQFILHNNDIVALLNSTKASIPFLVERMKDMRPEQEVIAECKREIFEERLAKGLDAEE